MSRDMNEYVLSDSNSLPGKDIPPTAAAGETGKKRRGRFGFFRAAALMMGMRQTEKDSEKKPIDSERKKCNADWTKFLGAMRPMHLQETTDLESPAPEEMIVATAAEKEPPSDGEVIGEELFPQVMDGDESAGEEEKIHPETESNAAAATPQSPIASSSSGTTSKYNSALSLRDLYDSSSEEDDEEDPDEVFDAICGDEMIDAKAEAFIAQFYQQIQLQKTTVATRRRH